MTLMFPLLLKTTSGVRVLDISRNKLSFMIDLLMRKYRRGA